MTESIRQQVKTLIPDILPQGHVPLNVKRVRFIRGEGVVVYNDTYAVEIFVPRRNGEAPVFFGVQKHRGNIDDLFQYYLKPQVIDFTSTRLSDEVKQVFEEAVFQFQPVSFPENEWITTTGQVAEMSNYERHSHQQNDYSAIEIVMHSNLSGAA